MKVEENLKASLGGKADGSVERLEVRAEVRVIVRGTGCDPVPEWQTNGVELEG